MPNGRDWGKIFARWRERGIGEQDVANYMRSIGAREEPVEQSLTERLGGAAKGAAKTVLEAQTIPGRQEIARQAGAGLSHMASTVGEGAMRAAGAGARALGFRGQQSLSGLVKDEEPQNVFERGAGALREGRELLMQETEPTSSVGRVSRVGAMLGAYGLPYAATGGSAHPVLASGGLTALQALAGRDASTTGALADVTGNETLNRLAESPAARTGLDVAFDVGMAGLGRALSRGGQAAGKAPRPSRLTLPEGQYENASGDVFSRETPLFLASGPSLASPRTAPETRLDRLLPEHGVLGRPVGEPFPEPVQGPGMAMPPVGGRTGAVAPEALGGLAGAGIGAVAGGLTGDTPEDRLGRALVGAGAGAGVGIAGARLARGAERSAMRGAVRVPPKQSPYAEGIVKGSVGEPKPVSPSKPLFNPSLSNLDPTGRKLHLEEQDRLIRAGESKTRVSDAELRKYASVLDLDRLIKSDVAKWDASELKAAAIRIADSRKEYAALEDAVTPSMSAEALEANLQQRETLLNRLLEYDRQLNRASSEQGRGLRVLSRLALERGTPESMQRAAQKALGTERLSETLQQRLSQIHLDPNLTDKQKRLEWIKVVAEQQKRPAWEAVMDIRRFGMLTAPATHAVNLAGNIGEALAENAVITPTAAALDALWSKVAGEGRTVTTVGRGTGLAKGAKTGVQHVRENWDAIKRGIDPEQDIMHNLKRARINYIQSLGLEETAADAAWKKSLRGGAAVLQTAADHVYGALSASDRVSFDAALSASLHERAALRAINEGHRVGTPAFQHRFRELTKLENISPVDAVAAELDALEATFKAPTVVSRVIRQSPTVMRVAGEWLIPFANTPTNIVRKALEATPVMGQGITEMRVAQLKKKLTGIGATEAEVANEVRRMRTKGIARQLTTGLGAVMAGFLLTKSGKLSGDFVDPRAQTDQQRQEAGEQRLTGQGPLTLRVGDQAYSLVALGQFAPLLAMGHALAMESDREQEENRGTLVHAGRSVASTAGSIGRTMMDFPMMQGLSSGMEFLRGERDMGTWLGREAATLVPGSSAVAAAARATDPVARRDPEGFAEAVKERIPGLRQEVAPKVGVFGEVPTFTAGERALNLVNPFRPQPLNTGKLYDALSALDMQPTAARRERAETQSAFGERTKPIPRQGESPAEYMSRLTRPRGEEETKQQYAARRQREGAAERALLEGLLSGDPRAFQFVSPQARRDFALTGDWRSLLEAALSRQRAMATRQRKTQVTMPVGSGGPGG